MPDTKAPAKKKRHGINPWVPNQHGAWPMVVIPVVLGTIVGLIGTDYLRPSQVLALVLTWISWIIGYCCFFAAGLLLKARRRANRGRYLKPTIVYGVISLLALLGAVALFPQLLWWAIPFAPLVVIAVEEMWRGEPRSTLSGVATTIASALVLPVTTALAYGNGHPAEVDWRTWASTFVIAAYFTGTVPYVKSMIRARGNKRYLKGSIAYQIIAAAITMWAVLFVGMHWLPAGLMIGVMVWAVYRSIAVPRSADRGEVWTPKRVGKAEMPLNFVLIVAVILAAILSR